MIWENGKTCAYTRVTCWFFFFFAGWRFALLLLCYVQLRKLNINVHYSAYTYDGDNVRIQSGKNILHKNITRVRIHQCFEVERLATVSWCIQKRSEAISVYIAHEQS